MEGTGGESIGEGVEHPHSPGTPPSWHLITWELSKPCTLQIFMEASVYRFGWLSHWFPAPITTPEVGPKRGRLPEHSNHLVGCPSNQPPPQWLPGGLPKITSLTQVQVWLKGLTGLRIRDQIQQKMLPLLLCLQTPQSLGTYEPGTGRRPDIYFVL